MNLSRPFSVALILGTVFTGPAFSDQTGVTGQSIKIGIFGPVTGPASVFAKTVYGAAAIYKDVNDRGGINGRKFELVIEDDACDPNKGIAAVKKLSAQDQVFLLHGAFCTSVALAVKPEIARQPSLPYMILGAASADISTPVLPNLFHPIPTSKIVSEQMAEFALSKTGAKKIAIIRHSDEWGTAFSEPAIARLKERGITPVAIEALERGGTDATSQVLAIKKASPDVVLAVLYPAELAVYLREAYKFGLKTSTVTTTGDSLDDTDKRLGIPAALDHVFMGYALSAQVTARELAPFTAIFRKYYPSEALDTMSLYSMTGALAVVEAVKRAGPDLTREGVIQELNKLNHFAPGIFAGDITFTPSDHAGVKAVKFAALINKKVVLFDQYPNPPKPGLAASR